MYDVVFNWRLLSDLSVMEFYEIVRLRESIFVVEQNCAYQEIDAADARAWHLVMRINGRLAGYLRMITADAPRIGRVLIAPEFRGQGLAYQLMGEAIEAIQRFRPGEPIHLSAQAHLRSFYEKLGFEVISDVYQEIGIPHCAMKLGARNVKKTSQGA